MAIMIGAWSLPIKIGFVAFKEEVIGMQAVSRLHLPFHFFIFRLCVVSELLTVIGRLHPNSSLIDIAYIFW